jgi:hypothetical protein
MFRLLESRLKFNPSRAQLHGLASMTAKVNHAQLVPPARRQPGVSVHHFLSPGESPLFRTRRRREGGGNLSIAAFHQMSLMRRIATVVDRHEIKPYGALILCHQGCREG